MAREARDPWIAAGVALVVRLAVAAWAAPRFPASADGEYFAVLARRLAEGHGYTWAWPDGAVTNVAHYPVGYPALIAAVYAALRGGVSVAAAAMVVNAVVGAGAAFAAQRLVRGAGTRAAAMGAGIAVALHPALVPYAAAVMTEGVAAGLLVIAAAVLGSGSGSGSGSGPGSGSRAAVLAGLALGVATLVRPQCIALAPALGWLAGGGWRARLRGAVVVTAVALATCLPWTARNCVAMHRCALVSVNGGWNLLIGAQTDSGAWQPVDVPEACRTVWDEAAKDTCFERAARDVIARAPGAWLAKAPAKIGATLDYFGAAPWYLHAANPAAFDDRDKLVLGAVETIASRLALVFALVAVARWPGSPGAPAWRRRGRVALAAAGAIFAGAVHAWPAYVALVGAIAAIGPRAPRLFAWTAIVVAATIATHAVFFGAGRYGLVVVPLVTALAFCVRSPAARRGSPMPPAASES